MTLAYAKWRRLCIISYCALLFTIVLWYFILSPPQLIISAIFSVLYLAILLSPAYGLFRQQGGVYSWSSFLMLIFFSHALIEIWANSTYRLLAVAELIFSGIYFFAATVCARFSKN